MWLHNVVFFQYLEGCALKSIKYYPTSERNPGYRYQSKEHSGVEFLLIEQLFLTECETQNTRSNIKGESFSFSLGIIFSLWI